WPPVIAAGIPSIGWRATMLAFGIVSGLAVVAAGLVCLRQPPTGHLTFNAEASGGAIPGQSARRTFSLLCLAGFLCFTPVAMPLGHVIALCSDLGVAPSRGALMLSVMLGAAFISRLFWGWLSDTVGGLYTVLAGSICQAAAMVGFILTQDEAGLVAVAA